LQKNSFQKTFFMKRKLNKYIWFLNEVMFLAPLNAFGPYCHFLNNKIFKKKNLIGALKYVNLKKSPFCEFQWWFENKD
jgi:hypothetical protein